MLWNISCMKVSMKLKWNLHNMNIGQRIIEIRQNTPRKTFATRVGIVENTLRNYEKGLSLPNSDVISKICTKFNISPIWLLDGTGDMYCTNTNTLQEPATLPQGISLADKNLIFIPMVEATLSAGGGSFETGADHQYLYPFKRDFLERKGNPKNMVLMRVAGDSMQPEILDNDMVLLDQSKKEIIPGRIFAVGFEDCIYLKRIDLLPGKVILKSSNPEYPPVELDIREDMSSLFRVIGKVLWAGREYL